MCYPYLGQTNQMISFSNQYMMSGPGIYCGFPDPFFYGEKIL
jgi:hypothetical protein